MASGYSVMSNFNKKSVGHMEKTSCARFRTKDISIKNIYSSDLNFYPQRGIEQKASEIQAVGLLSNLVVVHAPCEKGEYKLISGERRWRALNLLVEKGFTEFEKVTCQIRESMNEHEEMIQLILANSAREKDTFTLAKEEQTLKRELEYMREHGLKLNGYDLQEGRLRDVIADILGVSKTKVAELEAISNRLIPSWSLQLEEKTLSSSVAYQISKLNPADQYKLWQMHPKNISLNDVQAFLENQKKEETVLLSKDDAGEKELPVEDKTEDNVGQTESLVMPKEEKEPVTEEEQLPGQMILNKDGDCVDGEDTPDDNDGESSAILETDEKAIVAESAQTSKKKEVCNELINREMTLVKKMHADENFSLDIRLKHQIMLDALMLYRKRLGDDSF